MINSENNDRENGKIKHSSPLIHPAEGEKLLLLARSAIENYLRYGEIPKDCIKEKEPSSKNGLFVTLWQETIPRSGKHLTDEQELRGCIGHLDSDLSLENLVQEVAVAAATRDPRFSPLSVAELATTKIEIALLSPLRLISDLHQINIGQDGLLIEGLGRRGLLLPKVAVRMGWDRSAFLEHVCRKAGLPLGCWPGICELYAFTTTVFTEGDSSMQ